MKKHLIFIICLIACPNCGPGGRSEPLRFERIQKADTLVFQAQVDSSLASGSWEYKFRIKQADRVSLVIELQSDKEGLSAKLVRNDFLLPDIYHCPKATIKEKLCKLEIPNPGAGEYSLVLDLSQKESSEPLFYRIFAAVHGPGFASVAWEEEIVRR
ncbi:hypothetical protein [Leptospira sarikeiensis]|uniref:Lipoprotein n=1 Tax=Leptospira sarikeiensis TaxID=2484943 RepID=A0A4R9KEA5_9LEPT|nr:hypothetical protein [Leptospira sarikeiensis]TGL63533.1 hypothetical protein EHQ64_06165 [Leptospira sarikeiensis]